MYFVGNVKTGHYACPVEYVKEKCTSRGNKVFMTRTFPIAPVRVGTGQDTCKVIVGGHCDKKPTVLVSTRGKSTPGKTMTRYFRAWVDGEVITEQYKLE